MEVTWGGEGIQFRNEICIEDVVSVQGESPGGWGQVDGVVPLFSVRIEGSLMPLNVWVAGGDGGGVVGASAIENDDLVSPSQFVEAAP